MKSISKIATASLILLGSSVYVSAHRGPDAGHRQNCCTAAVQQPTRHTRTARKKRHARHHKRRHREVSTMPWNMVKVKTVQGFYLTVHPAYAHKFLRFFEILAQNNVSVPKEIVGCYARGKHKPGSNHYIGAACDIQWGWNKTIPSMYHAGKWIKEAGLYDGCSFGDCGHIEAVRGLYNKAPNLYASLEKFKAMESTLNYQP
jgi:hypothetical protein